MIEYLRGVLLDRSGQHVVIDVQGVGYGVSAPARTVERLGEPGVEVVLWIRTYVREDILRLYGFARREERDLFDLLLGIPSVGPQICLSLLSAMSIGDLVQSVVAEDIKSLTAIKGIGRKVAEKMLLELKGRTDALAACLPPGEKAEATAPIPGGVAARDAIEALEALDVPLAQARRAIQKAVEILGADASTEALVREGLKHRRTA